MAASLLYRVNITDPATGDPVTFDPQPVATLPAYAVDALSLHAPQYIGDTTPEA